MARLFDFGAGSGLETLARLRLAGVVQRVETQVAIPGLAVYGGGGRVDLLIDGWPVIELDGDRWHDPATDRRRNQRLAQRGYRVHRFGFDQVVNDWPAVL